MKKELTKNINRREFSKTIAAGSIGATLFGGTASSYARIIGSNKKIGIGIIGLGSIVYYDHLNRMKEVQDKAQITAVCDIYKPRLEWGKSVTGARGYHDYRDLLADKNVDAENNKAIVQIRTNANCTIASRVPWIFILFIPAIMSCFLSKLLIFNDFFQHWIP